MSTVPLTKGERTRQSILSTAAAISSEHGLDTLSIGGLAEATGLSKSGLFAHFGSREELQLATVEHAAEVFTHEVIDRARSAPKGVARVWALLDSFLDYLEREVFPGGCFFSVTSVEFRNRPGPVRDRIVSKLANWHSYLHHAIEQAQALGELDPDADARQVAYELNAFVGNAKASYQLFNDGQVFEHARAAIRDRIDSLRPVRA
jgi:AcrR family transcriptional regulator